MSAGAAASVLFLSVSLRNNRSEVSRAHNVVIFARGSKGDLSLLMTQSCVCRKTLNYFFRRDKLCRMLRITKKKKKATVINILKYFIDNLL